MNPNPEIALKIHALDTNSISRLNQLKDRNCILTSSTKGPRGIWAMHATTSVPKRYVFGPLGAFDVLKDEAIRRGYEGWREPVFYQGHQCGTIRRYSDRLLMALLKLGKPEKYGSCLL